MSLPTASINMHTLTELGLNKMNIIFTFILTNNTLLNSMSTTNLNELSSKQLISNSMNEAIVFIEKNIQACIEVATNEKHKILNQKYKFKKLPTVESVMKAIEDRQQNMIQRIQYHIEQTMKIVFPEK